MKYNLTEKQKELARWIVEGIRNQDFGETFFVVWPKGKLDELGAYVFEPSSYRPMRHHVDRGALEMLAADGLLRIAEEAPPNGNITQRIPGVLAYSPVSLRCTITAKGFTAADSGFLEEENPLPPLSTIAHAAPQELNMSLDRLKKNHPDPAKLGFLIMRFTSGKPFGEIVKAIKETAETYGISIVRADENEFHSDLWGNVRTLLHGCSFGVAVYERIEQEEPNANVGLEVGYLMAMNKPVLLLKERTIKALQADLMGKLYRQFDEHDPAATIPNQLEGWLSDNGIIVRT